MTRSARLLVAASAVAGLALGAGSASALTISGVAVTKNGANTANFLNDTLTDYREFKSAVSVLDSGGSAVDWFAATVDAKTRYSATTDADGGVATAPNQSGTSDYHITFTVSAGTGWSYNVTINTSRLGALTRVDDGTGGGSASIGAVTGKLNGSTNATLGSGMSAVSLSQGTGAANTPFSQSTPTLTLTGLTGTNTITLDFSWTSNANSTCTGTGCSTTGNDEMAVRLGEADSTSGASAGDYPGVGSRTQSADGHIVTVAATLTTYVPEPGSLALLAVGMAGLARFGRRKTA